MTRKEQNKILDAQIESNVNQYKVDRLNAEISAFSSGDLNKYEFLKGIDLNCKPNALDKARFEFSPLGQTFSIGLDKTAQGYQEEGVMKLLKDIRDNLARPVIDNKKVTKDILDEAGKKINKFYQEKSMYYNELEYKLRRNSQLIEQRDDIFRDIVRHARSNQSEKQITIDVLNQDIERLNNLNEEHLNKVYKYEEKNKKLKDNLSSEKKV